jgi:hypothetical protein
MMFFNRQTLVRSTLATALLSALVLSQSANAGLLGGGGGGGLAGGLQTRGLGVGGNATGQFSHDAVSLPRADKAKTKLDDATQKAGETGQSAATKSSGAAAAGANASRNAVEKGSSATSSTSGNVGAARGADASATGSAQASRGDRSVSTDASAQGSASR